MYILLQCIGTMMQLFAGMMIGFGIFRLVGFFMTERANPEFIFINSDQVKDMPVQLRDFLFSEQSTGLQRFVMGRKHKGSPYMECFNIAVAQANKIKSLHLEQGSVQSVVSVGMIEVMYYHRLWFQGGSVNYGPLKSYQPIDSLMSLTQTDY